MYGVRFAPRHLLYFLIGAGMLVPAAAPAQVAQEKVFFDTLYAACLATTDPAFSSVCSSALAGALSSGVYVPGASVVNVGSTGSYASAGKAGMQRGLEEVIGDEDAKKRRKRGGGSGDFTAGPFGGFVTVQTSRTTRDLTELENGYQAKLDGLLIGLDRRFGDDLVAGGSLGGSDTDSTYLGGDTISARNTTLMLYTTYLLGPRAYLGAYLGGGKGTQDATRRISVSLISGSAASTTESVQTMGGLSGGYNWYSGALSLGFTGAADYVKSRTDATTETGTTGLELAFPEQTTTSLTGTLGARASYRSSFTWGAIVPSVRVAYVHEFKDDARTVSPRLAISPSTVFAFQTDSPDRDYYIGGAGATIEMGRGTQVFVDYEKRGGHRFLDNWSASVGLIVEF